MDNTTVVLVPVLWRPRAVGPLLAYFEAATPERHRLLFICDPDDRLEQDAVRAHGAAMLLHDGNYAQKINAGVRATDEPYIFMAADDLRPRLGWLSNALRRMTPGTRVVGTNDLGNRRVMAGQHATHNLVARDYIDRFGVIDAPGQALCEVYRHNFCDDELVATAKHRGMWDFAPDSIVEHLHPFWNKGEDDATYRKGIKHFRRDRMVFRNRKDLWTSPSS